MKTVETRQVGRFIVERYKAAGHPPHYSILVPLNKEEDWDKYSLVVTYQRRFYGEFITRHIPNHIKNLPHAEQRREVAAAYYKNRWRVVERIVRRAFPELSENITFPFIISPYKKL